MANLAYIQLTRRCNQKCLFCSNPELDKDIKINYAKKLINKYRRERYEGVIFSGGEPTLCDFLPQIINYAKRPNFSVRVITNGQKTADQAFFKTLLNAGLTHLSVSVYSDNSKIQNFLTQNPSSLKNIKKTLNLCKRFKLHCDIGITINKFNSDHLSRLVKSIVTDFPFIKHFIFNNLDPSNNRATENPHTIPKLNDFELELHNTLRFLRESNRTFRVERVPLCYMVDFADSSTETRKIVKHEKRAVYFLDEKKLVRQNKWCYEKAAVCSICSLNSVCAGLYRMDNYYSSKELYPIFKSKKEVYLLKRLIKG